MDVVLGWLVILTIHFHLQALPSHLQFSSFVHFTTADSLPLMSEQNLTSIQMAVQEMKLHMIRCCFANIPVHFCGHVLELLMKKYIEIILRIYT